MRLGNFELNEIYTGDARELSHGIPDESIDLIFTDPVYDRIDDYRWLAETAARVLKPEGSLLAFQGVNLISETLQQMPINYRGLFCWRLMGSGKGNHNKIYGKTIDNGNWLLWFGGWPKKHLPLVWDSYNNWSTKIGFHWQKDPALVMRFIADFTDSYSIIFDPFCGSGTVPAVCKMLGRNYLAFEIDPETAERARERVQNTQPPLFTLQPTQQELFT